MAKITRPAPLTLEQLNKASAWLLSMYLIHTYVQPKEEAIVGHVVEMAQEGKDDDYSVTVSCVPQEDGTLLQEVIVTMRNGMSGKDPVRTPAIIGLREFQTETNGSYADACAVIG